MKPTATAQRMRSSSPPRKTVRMPPPERPAAADAGGIDIGPGAEHVEGPLVLDDIDAGPGGAGAEQALFHDVLVRGGEGVVAA